jgi:hypothetical protein
MKPFSTALALARISLTCLLEGRVYSSKNLRSTVQKDFCNKIGHERTHALQKTAPYSITRERWRQNAH